VLHLPVVHNVRDRTLHGSKWFGAAGFGRHYLSALRLWILRDGETIALDRTNQRSFVQELAEVIREYDAGGAVIRETVFVPGRREAIMVRIEADRAVRLVAEPEFDMRYYQALNRDFSTYRAGRQPDSGIPGFWVTNSIPPPTPALTQLDFAAVVSLADGELEMLRDDLRLRRKSFRLDEMRQKAIHLASPETHVEGPDEAPIWDQYESTAFAPARLHGELPLTLVFGFGSTVDEAAAAAESVREEGDALRDSRRKVAQQWLERAAVTTGEAAVDTACALVHTRFDQCLVARDMVVRTGRGQPDAKASAILAGNKYFLDPWKRDENISLGMLLVTGDFETARDILHDTWQFQDPRTGRLPQIMRLGEELVYYSSDGTLWALQRLHEYTRASGDQALLEAKYALVEHFFQASLSFVRRGLLPSGGVVDPSYLWETWMDTPYTPRDGYPVEIELLWLTTLAEFTPLIAERNPELAQRLEATQAEGRDTFRSFYLDGYLADSLDYDFQPRDLLTPNGYIAFGLGYPLPVDLARRMVALGREQLAGRLGIRSLAPRDWPRVLSPEFMADPHNFDGPNMASVGIYNYHRGVEWLWLNQFFVRAELQYGDPDTAYGTYLEGQVHSALHESGVGGLSELNDIHGPLGADFQAWSMAGFVEALRAFGGTVVDGRAGSVTVCPSLPRRWSGMRWKTRIGDTWLALHYERARDGAQTLEIAHVGDGALNFSLRVGLPLHRTTGRAFVILDHREVEPAREEQADGRLYFEAEPAGASVVRCGRR